MTILLGVLLLLCNVCPSLSLNHLVNGTDSNAVFVGECLLSDPSSGISAANTTDNIFVQLRMGECRASDVSALVAHVVEVVGPRAQKEMNRVDASRRVALVAHEHSIRDRPEGQPPRKPMGQFVDMPSVVGDAALDLTVPALSDRAGPQPAAIGLVDALPKAFSPGARIPFEVTSTRAEYASFSRQNLKFTPAYRTGASDASLNRRCHLVSSVVTPAFYHVLATESNWYASSFALISGAGFLQSILMLICLGLVFYLLYWLVNFINPPEPFHKIIISILAIAGVIVLIHFIMSMVGIEIIQW